MNSAAYWKSNTDCSCRLCHHRESRSQEIDRLNYFDFRGQIGEIDDFSPLSQGLEGLIKVVKEFGKIEILSQESAVEA